MINITIEFFTYLTVIYVSNFFLLETLKSYFIYTYLIYKFKIILYLIYVTILFYK